MMWALRWQDVGISHLCEGVCEQTLGNGLQTLVIWNNQITYQCMKAVAEALVGHIFCCTQHTL